MSTSAFGVEHTISKAGPYPGGKFTSAASEKDRKKATSRFTGALIVGGAGGGLVGGLAGPKGRVPGAVLAAGALGAHAIGSTRDVKRGVIANPYKVSKGGINPVSRTHGVGIPLGPLATRLRGEKVAESLTGKKPKFRMKASELQRINPATPKRPGNLKMADLQRKK